ncbi:MAG: DNA repair protein RadC [Chitinivibrionales bacterium]|nr:DNA repair protein RadC [Chitinivibrionales bacterium]
MAEISSEGHRRRLLERYRNNGLSSLQDYEIIELLLTYIIPRKDTKKTAKALLGNHRNISELLHVDPAELRKAPGITERGAALFTLLRDIIAYCLKEKYESKPIITHRKDVEEYLRFHYGNQKTEYIAVIYLDNAHRIIATEKVSEGTTNQCVIYPRTILEQALQKKAASLILAHNHPGGTLECSEADWKITKRLFQICKLLETPLLDHIIISKEKVISLRELPRWPN